MLRAPNIEKYCSQSIHYLLCTVLLLMLCMTQTLQAKSLGADVLAATLSTDKKGNTERVYTLESFGANKDIKLYGVDGRQRVPFAIRYDEVVTGAKLDLVYRYSPGLLPKVSQINILLNGYPIASYPVGRKFPMKGVIHIDLNPLMLEEYNGLTFQLIGHYTLTECEYPNHTSLWAVIDKHSTLTLKTKKVRVASTLAHLPEPFFDPHDSRELRLPMVFAGKVSLDSMKAAGIISSWFGKYAAYRGAKFPVSFNRLPKKGNAIVFIKGASRIQGLKTVQSNLPTLSIERNPNDPFGHLLIIRGKNDQSILMAATALALGQIALSGTTSQVLELNMPPKRKAYDAPRWLPSDRPVLFKELVDNKKLQVQGSFPDLIRLNFNMPPDLFDWRGYGAKVNFGYRYVLLEKEGRARLNVNFNDHFVTSYALHGAITDSPVSSWWEKTADRLTGKEEFSEGSFNIPSAWLGFYNRLSFHYQMANNIGKCQEANRGFQGAVEPTSSIDISQTPHFVQMPNLSLFSKLGYPFTRLADLSETVVIVPDHIDSDTVAAFLELMSMMGASTGYPVVHVSLDHIGAMDKYHDDDVLVLGKLEAERLFSHLQKDMPVSVHQGHLQLKNLGAMDYAWSFFNGKDKQNDIKHGGDIIMSSNGNMGLLTSFESPWKSGRTVVVVSASGNKTLENVSRYVSGDMRLETISADTIFLKDSNSTSVVRPLYYMKDEKGMRDVSPKLHNKSNILLSKKYHDSLSAFDFASSYHVGKLPFGTWLLWFFATTSWALALVTILGILLLSALAYMLIRRRARRRIAGDV